MFLQLLKAFSGDVLTMLVGLGGDSIFPDGTDTVVYVNYENPTTILNSGHGSGANMTQPGHSVQSNINTYIGQSGKNGRIVPVSTFIPPGGNGGNASIAAGGYGATATTFAGNGFNGSGGGGGFPVSQHIQGGNGGDGFVMLILISE